MFRSLQAGRGIAALGVVLYHCGGLFSLSKYWSVKSHYFFFGQTGVEFFFVLSGIVILHAHLKDLGRPDRLGTYFEKRFRRVYPIYWIVLLTLLPLYYMVPDFGKGLERQPVALADAVLLLPIFHTVNVIPVAWTLEHEVIFYLLFASMLINRRVGQVILGLWMLASIVCLYLNPAQSWLDLWLSPLHLLFGMGMLARLLWQRVNWNGTLLAVIGIAGFIGCLVLVALTGSSARFLVLAYGFFAMLTCLGCMLIEKHRPMKIPAALLLLGDASYSLYLIHYAVLSASAKVVYRIWSRHRMPLEIPFLVLFTTAIGAGFLLHLFVEAPLVRWISRRSPAAPQRPLEF